MFIERLGKSCQFDAVLPRPLLVTFPELVSFANLVCIIEPDGNFDASRVPLIVVGVYPVIVPFPFNVIAIILLSS